MNLLVLSDLHLSPTTSERNEQFLQFLEAARDHGDNVLIAGDLFDIWFGWNNLTMEFQRPILDKMHELFSSGLKMDYVEGNRDFGISHQQGILFHRVCTEACQIDWYGRKIHAVHGDLINQSDRQYRLWRKFSKNKFSYFLIGLLPAFVTLRVALRLEKDLRNTNRRHKMFYPEASIEKFSIRMAESGSDVIVVGHFHIEKIRQVQSANRNVLFYNLPGWEQGLRYLVIPPGNETPYFKDWGKENGNSATA